MKGRSNAEKTQQQQCKILIPELGARARPVGSGIDSRSLG
jgi:hypothetical protein